MLEKESVYYEDENVFDDVCFFDFIIAIIRYFILEFRFIIFCNEKRKGMLIKRYGYDS